MKTKPKTKRKVLKSRPRRRRSSPAKRAPLLALGSRVYVALRDEVCRIVGRSEFIDIPPGYRVATRNGKIWFDESDVAAV